MIRHHPYFAGARPLSFLCGHQFPTVPKTSDRITERLSEQIGEHRFAMWFGQADITVDGTRVQVKAHSQFVADWINHRFNRELRAVASETLGSDADVRISVETRDAPRRHEQPSEGDRGARSNRPPAPDRDRGRRSTPPRPARQLGGGFASLDDFIVGASNRLAWSAATQLGDEGERSSVSPLFIHGGCGLGKTHLLQGICRRAAERMGDRSRIRYVTGEQFTNEYIMAVQTGSMDRFRRAHRGLRLLAIDDVHFLANKKKTQAEFLHTLDAIGLTGARLALASDEHPSTIARFSEGLVSRFLSGMVVEIEEPDPATRLELVRQLATRRDLQLSDAAARLIASNCPGSVRELQGMLTRLEAMQMLDPAQVQAADADQMLIPGIDEFGRRIIGSTTVQRLLQHRALDRTIHVTLSDIMEAVCTKTGVTRDDLTGRARHRRISLARAMFAYLAREMTTRSYPEIGRALGRNNHSSVHAAAKRLARTLDENPLVEFNRSEPPLDLLQAMAEIRRRLRA